MQDAPQDARIPRPRKNHCQRGTESDEEESSAITAPGAASQLIKAKLQLIHSFFVARSTISVAIIVVVDVWLVVQFEVTCP